MGYQPLVQNNASTTITGAITNIDTTMTLQSPFLGTLTYKVYLTIEPTNSTKFDLAYCTVTGAAVTQMERSNPLAHDSGSVVRMATPAEIVNNLLSFMESGWVKVPNYLAATFVDANHLTIAGDWTGILNKGDKLQLINGSLKKFYIIGTSVSSNITTVTVTGGSDFTLVSGAITNVQYSKEESPAGFPGHFNFIPSFTGFSINPSGFNCLFKISGEVLHFYYTAVTRGTSNSGAFTMTLPLNAAYSSPLSQIAVCDNGSWKSGVSQVLYLSNMLSMGSGTGAAIGGFASSGLKDANLYTSYLI